MYRQRQIAVVVPAYQEQRLVTVTLRSVPSYVDTIHVVDDGSSDGTCERASSVDDPRVQVLRHSQNTGVGAAIATGYRSALKKGAEVLAVMAADNQMHPDDLSALLDPVIEDRTDYAKGNRFIHPEHRLMPWQRRLGGRLLARLTCLATGYGIDDSQCGFTALSRAAASRLPFDDLYPRFGYPNDMLGLLAAAGLRVMDVPVRPVYADEASGIRPHHMLTIASVIARRRWRSPPKIPLGGSSAAVNSVALASPAPDTPPVELQRYHRKHSS